MKRLPTPALMLIAAFSASTASGLLERWISWFSGCSLEPAAVFVGMMFSAVIASLAVVASRSNL